MRRIVLGVVCLAACALMAWLARGLREPVAHGPLELAPSEAARASDPRARVQLEESADPVVAPRTPRSVQVAAPIRAVPLPLLPLPRLTGAREFESPPVGFGGAELVEVPHVFVLENRGSDPITFVAAHVTIATVLAETRWPLRLEPDERGSFEVVNKLRMGEAEKTSRVELVTDSGERVTLVLVARAAR